MTFFGAFEEYTPDEPHWYLPMIGLDPRHFGHGLGTALMKHVLDIIDEKPKIAHLDSTNPKNVSLYKRCGFEVMGKIKVGGEHIVTPMTRQKS